MFKKERQNKIIEIIEDKKYCSVEYLASKLFVAPITIRRDLSEMQKAGIISRVHGGATIPKHKNREVPFEVRDKENYYEKEILAQNAIKYINIGDVIFLDASSTVSHMVDYLKPELNVTVITNSILIASKLQNKQITCYVTGGRTVDNSYALLGEIAKSTISKMHANACFFSSQGIDHDGIVSDQSEAETELRRLMIANSDRQYLMADTSKYNKRFTFTVCDVENITDIVDVQ